jgi:hypothetical protein
MSKRSRDYYVQLVAKCLTLANDPGATEEEAHAALLRAQTLMYDHDIAESEATAEDRDAFDDPVDVILDQAGQRRPWKNILANIIASNFRCECYFVKAREKSGKRLFETRFVGLIEDVKVASMTYHTAIRAADALSTRFLIENERLYRDRDDAKIAYQTGFVNGLEEKYREQVKSMSLMVVAGQLVKTYVEQETAGDVTEVKLETKDEHFALVQGYRDGQQFGDEKKGLEEGE